MFTRTRTVVLKSLEGSTSFDQRCIEGNERSWIKKKSQIFDPQNSKIIFFDEGM